MRTLYYMIENNLFQGGMPDETMPRDITAVMTLSNEPIGHLLHPDVEMHCWLPIPDGPFPGMKWLEAAVKMVETMIEAGHRVYIHCRAGVSRSAMVTIAYLMKKHGWSLDTAMDWVGAENPEINPNPRFIMGLREYEDQLQGVR
jgi:protein-tyrosine phosphatase